MPSSRRSRLGLIPYEILILRQYHSLIANEEPFHVLLVIGSYNEWYKLQHSRALYLLEDHGRDMLVCADEIRVGAATLGPQV